MKKIINGKRYDTNTAKLIGEASYSNPSDFNYWCEELYRKRTGEFFLYGDGGPMSKYSRSIGQNEWSGGEEIQPLTLEEAQEWGEQYLNADEYEEMFGRVEEGKTQVATWLLDSVKADADNLREKGYTLADVFTAGINILKEREKEMIKKLTCEQFIEEFQLGSSWRQDGSPEIKVTVNEIIGSPECMIEREDDQRIILAGEYKYIITDEENLNTEYETVCE